MGYLSSLKRKAYLIVARYFRWWADKALRRWQPRIIAVTGSVGKTTMLHLIENQLGKRAHYSHNANSAFGIAFDIVGLRGITNTKLRWFYLLIAVPWRAMTFTRHREYYVVEIDGERPDEVEFLASWLRPEVTIWVSIGNSHAVYFDRQVAAGEYETVEEAIAHEFSRLARHTTKYVIANGDEPLVRASLEKVRVRTDFVSLSELQDYAVWPNRAEFSFGESQVYTFSYPMPKETGLQLGMLAKLLLYLELPIEYSLKGFTMPPGRSNYFDGVQGTKLVDSSYNAHLISMRSVLDMFDVMQTDHKWLVLGDMIEQGKSERDQHEQLAHRILESNAERVILVGRRLKTYTLPIVQTSPTFQVACFDSPLEAYDYIHSEIHGGETLLFKGSQYLEWIVEKLLNDPTHDKALLARQEPAAIKRRKKRGLL
ncbi:MAG TPA: Mur ligase family protein [Patescibacteria group bacterium]|jgi:UDP-N-acetylmuramoyl-tripeptide--D-alanyl-D-alanine ligase|nr:Mur ligase family protein [Patescibacteria group bacterium]